ncbi:MAG TPA: hypothetical protein VGT82_05065 [Ktedonobacteraceae bacterium]|nr:hypothetical protein [Ktedonobacteraceae bacterium]
MGHHYKKEKKTMQAYYITSVSGWVILGLLVATILYPFLLRSGFLGPVQPFLKRMRLHYWLGYSITALVIVHAWIPMSERLAGSVNALGLYLGTGALLLVFVQVALGRQLSWPKLSLRRVVRRWHFWVMVGLVAFVVGHIVLDSATIQGLIAR